ncbi:MAG TPA: class I SAM-dependent methyltransferase [Propionibacteriaceae bacterium]
MSVRQQAWRACYQLLASQVRSPDWAFMNYGYLSTDPVALDARDEPDRLCIQLYLEVLAGTPLTGRDLLEVGSGRGGGSAYLHRANSPRSTTGLDFSRQAVRLSERDRSAPGLRFVPGDAQALPFPEASFDVVVNVESSHCYDSMPTFLAEVARVLRPGGVFCFADFRPVSRVEQLAAELRGNGLTFIDEDDLTAGVVAALRQDDDRKRALIETLIPRLFRRPFRRFAGITGTRTFDAFADGTLRYRRALLARPTH